MRLSGVLYISAAAALGLGTLAVGLAACRKAKDAPPDKDAPVVERKLLYVEGARGARINMRVGDVLQVQPFSFPVIPAYLNAHLSVDAGGDATVVPIGQLVASPGEGSGSQSMFLLAKSPGSAELKIVLLNEEGKEIKGHNATYNVRIDEPKR